MTPLPWVCPLLSTMVLGTSGPARSLPWDGAPCCEIILPALGSSPHLRDPDPGVPGSPPSSDLLDSSWAFFLISSFTSFCLCLILIDIVFFTNSNVPLLDFSNIILSNLTGMALRYFP